ncbi:hypothetical protein Tco_0773202 [Tanacetum coccineum]|uniref:Uncharacterized protein n=1 Tax=Tanacetum coccineum TaxID=301880 RepID=A0ABQ4ZM96_9ASTR
MHDDDSSDDSSEDNDEDISEDEDDASKLELCILDDQKAMSEDAKLQHENLISFVHQQGEDSVTRLVTDIEKLHTYKDELAALLEQLKIDIPNPPEMNKKELYAAALGVTEPAQVNIVAPICQNKGSVSTKRLQTQAEIAMIQSNKTPRQCKYCLQYGFHDSRNCPKKDADMADQENDSSE